MDRRVVVAHPAGAAPVRESCQLCFTRREALREDIRVFQGFNAQSAQQQADFPCAPPPGQHRSVGRALEPTLDSVERVRDACDFEEVEVTVVADEDLDWKLRFLPRDVLFLRGRLVASRGR